MFCIVYSRVNATNALEEKKDQRPEWNEEVTWGKGFPYRIVQEAGIVPGKYDWKSKGASR